MQFYGPKMSFAFSFSNFILVFKQIEYNTE